MEIYPVLKLWYSNTEVEYVGTSKEKAKEIFHRIDITEDELL